MHKKLTVTEPLLKLGLTLGEGCVWDTRQQRLYFVDIDTNRVFTYQPSTGEVGFETFEKKITAIALTEVGHGLVGTAEDGFIHIPETSLPFPPSSSLQPFEYIKTSNSVAFTSEEKRFNDGAVDPRGRFLAGTMGKEHNQSVGKLWSLRSDESVDVVLDKITCSNGMGWSLDGTKLYFTDSWIKEIAVFDYDLDTGSLLNRKTFSLIEDEAFGEPDGLCMDSEGGVWSARWQAGKVVRFSPEGVMDVEVDFPTAWHMTCVVFGGKDLDELYVTTAKSDYNGEDLPDRRDGGHVFMVKDLGYTGIERGRAAFTSA